jgi:hypothetical protein
MNWTTEEAQNFRTAFAALYDLIVRMPTALGDFFDDGTLAAIYKTSAALDGEPYDPAAWGGKAAVIPPPAFTQHLYWEVDYSDLEALIRSQFQQPSYSIVAAQEWANDSDYTYSVSLHGYDELERAEVARCMAGGPLEHRWKLSMLLQELAARQVIPEGDYLVRVCW